MELLFHPSAKRADRIPPLDHDDRASVPHDASQRAVHPLVQIALVSAMCLIAWGIIVAFGSIFFSLVASIL
jgi:hypothetical protein